MNIRIVHGRNKQHLYLILSNLKLKRNDEASRHLGLTLMVEMNCSLALALMERCRLVERESGASVAYRSSICYGGFKRECLLGVVPFIACDM